MMCTATVGAYAESLVPSFSSDGGGRKPAASFEEEGDTVPQDTLDASPSCPLEASREKHSRPWLAVAEVAGFNTGLLAFDRFVLNAAYAHVTMKTVRRNLEMTHWFWDSDLMPTNLFHHPYHGSLYYNAARSNGLNCWVSAAFATGGSLLWELMGEMELPSVNDFIATSFGGVIIGEVGWRLSDMILDDSRRGAARVFSEMGGAVLNPMRAFNRVLTGDAWRRNCHRTTFVPDRYRIALSTGVRYLTVSGAQHNDMCTASLDVDVDYGNPVVDGSENKPFSYFLLSGSVVLGSHQKIINRLNLLGRLAAWQVSSGGIRSEFGFYQHFNYYYTDGVHGGEVPYRISEAGSLGPGFVYEADAGSMRFHQGLYASAMLLGGMMSDYTDNIIGRDYNIGSGFTLRLFTGLDMGKWLHVRLDMELYRLFTWLDYSEIKNEASPYDCSIQGDEGVAGLIMLSPRVDVTLFKGLGLSLAGRYYNRHSRYKFHNTQHSHTWEWRLGINYTIGK